MDKLVCTIFKPLARPPKAGLMVARSYKIDRTSLTLDPAFRAGEARPISHYANLRINNPDYSSLNDSTGLTVAARMAW